ncbi:hypothetical protein L9F63_022911, partial [Diploptera punctata]
AGADRYDTARRKRVLEQGDRATPAELKVKKGNHSRTSEGASCSFTETPEVEHPRTFYHPELKRPRTCCPPVNVGPLPIKKRKFMHAPAGETEPGHHVVEQEVTVPPPPQQVPVQPQVFPASIHFIPCSPPPRVVPSLVSPFRLPSSQYQCSGSVPAEVPCTPPPTADHDYNSTQSHPVHERNLLFEQLMQEAERRLRDIHAMVRPVHYSQQSPVAPPLRHQYGMHHHHQLPEPTPQQPTVYSHPEGRSTMIPPPMVAPSLQAPDEQLMPIHHRNTPFGMYRQQPRLWIHTNTSQLTFERYTFLYKYKQ